MTSFSFIFVGIAVLAALLIPLRYLKPFRSVKFNVILFTVIGILSAVGTFIPQNKSAEVALAKLGPTWAKIFGAIGFLNIYHTWYFAALLGLMAFDVIVCKLRRLPLLPKRPKTTHQENFELSQSLKVTAGHLKSWFNKKGLSFREISGKDETVFIAERHSFQKWGDFILHVSIVVILAGNLFGAIFGFEEVLPLVENETVHMTNRPYDVTLKNFDIEYYAATGSPSLYASELSVVENGREIGNKKVVVNHPLEIDHVRFYQATWGTTDRFRSARLRVAGSEIVLEPGIPVAIPGTPLSLRANRFLPSFDVDSEGRPFTQDYQGANPALQIDFIQKGEVQVATWILKNHPKVAFKVQGDRAVRIAEPPPFGLIDVDAVLFSGIQVGYDPGAPIFWFGAVTLLIGACLHFYFHHRGLYIEISPDGKKTVVRIGGWSSRIPREFEKEFSEWTDGIKRTIRGD